MNTLTQIAASNILKHIENIVSFGPRVDASPGSLETGDYIGKCLQSYGIDVHRLPLEFSVAENVEARLETVGANSERIPCLANTRSALTDGKPLEAEAVFVAGGSESDYRQKDVKDKIVVCGEQRYWQDDSMVPTKYFRALEKGAKAFIFSDSRKDDTITCWTMSYDLTKIPTVSIPYSYFLKLKKECAEKKVVLRLVINGRLKRSTDYIISGYLPGLDSGSGTIIVDGSHHETVAYCPGANDNASGTAIMLELARFFSSNRIKNSLLFISTCAEECLCIGMQRYIEDEKRYLQNAIASFVIDQVAGANTGIIQRGIIYDIKNGYVPTGGYLNSDEKLVALLQESAQELGYVLPIYDAPGGSLGESNNFIDAGIPSVFICGWNTDPVYHTSLDTIDRVSVNSLKAIGDIVANTIMKKFDRGKLL
jgi:aminopeptidase YwaD